MEAVIGSDAASDDGMDALMLDRIFLSFLKVNVDSNLLGDSRVLLQERGSNG